MSDERFSYLFHHPETPLAIRVRSRAANVNLSLRVTGIETNGSGDVFIECEDDAKVPFTIHIAGEDLKGKSFVQLIQDEGREIDT